MNGQPEVKEMFAILVRDLDGTEAVAAVQMPSGQMMSGGCANERNARKMLTQLLLVGGTELTGCTITINRYTVREVLETIRL